MKKTLSIIIAAAFILSMCVIAVSAQSYNPAGGCDISVIIKKADPANVVKDGVIGDGEYEKFDADLSADTSNLDLVFGANTAMYDLAEQMLGTMEYYYSWDEVHGFNFAVRCKPSAYVQAIPQGTGNPPKDDFLANLGLMYEIDPTVTRGDKGNLYYCISKNAQTGEYIEGHYNQLGKTGSYDPVGGTDYEVGFGADGYITYEVSVPFNTFMDGNPADGSKFGFSVGAYAGSDTDNSFQDFYTDCYGVTFGDYAFLVDQRFGPQNAAATLSGEMITAGSGNTTPDSTTPGTDPIDTTNPGTDPADTTNPGTDPVDTTNPGTDPVNPADPTDQTIGEGNLDEMDNGTGNVPTNNGKAPATADPIVIAAIASAVSACGFAISRKKH